MKRSRTILLTSFTALAVGACITPPKPKLVVKRPQSATPVEKAGTKGPQQERSELSQITDDRVPSTSAGEFFLKHSQPTTAFTAEDENTLAEFPGNPPSGSIAEAALVVGVVKLSLKESQSAPNFQESNLVNADEPDTGHDSITEGVSLEALALDKQVDLPMALSNNNLLKNFVIFQQVVRALRETNNSPEFITNVKDVIDKQASLWSDNGAEQLFEPTDSLATMNNLDQDVIRNAVADIRLGDSLLMEAQSLAAGRRYRDAITKAAQIHDRSPLFATAQEKIVMFSTEAVQELRRKAAQAFQNAIPVSDEQARAAYLEQAKSHLEDALKNYPHAPADQLSTVRENLAVITRDLERLDIDLPADDSATENDLDY